jgi:hypothetical protein
MSPVATRLPTTPPTSPAATAAGPTSAAIARALLLAIVTWDEPRLRSLLADDVWLRAMLVTEVVEEHDPDAVVERFRGWYGTAAGLEVVRATHDTIATREAIAYRVRLRPSWAPEQWHLIEQSGYVRVRAGRVSRLDLVCTGFHPLPEGS